jgi:hypothetical protein
LIVVRAAGERQKSTQPRRSKISFRFSKDGVSRRLRLGIE